MNKMFDALQAIEQEASEITRAAEEKRDGLSSRLEAKRLEIKADVEKRTKEAIREYSMKSEQATFERISDISVESQRKYSALEVSFDRNHQMWELEIFNKIVGK